MLNFIHKTQTQKCRTPVKYHYERTNGISYESPSQFQNKFSIINRHSYLNPFLKYDNREGCSESDRSKSVTQPRWIYKTNFSNIQDRKITQTSQLKQDISDFRSRYLKRYSDQYSTNPLRFRIIKGQFTQYLNKNLHYRSIGPLQGMQRSYQRIQATKLALRQQKQLKLQILSNSNKLQSQLHNTIKSNFMKNSSLITQRSRIKQNREIVHRTFKRDLERRKKEVGYSFKLPHNQPRQQIFGPEYQQNSRRYKTESCQK